MHTSSDYLETSFYDQFNTMVLYMKESGTLSSKFILEGVTFYNVRQFLTLIYNNSKDSKLKSILLELLKVLTKLEIMNKPIPTIRKMKSISPEIF